METLEFRLRQVGKTFLYPPTPDIAAKVALKVERQARSRPWWQSERRRVAWAAALVLVLLCGLLAVPPVRAQIVEFLQIGAVRIFLGESTSTPAVTATADPASKPAPLTTQTPLPSFLNLAGETTLQQARQNAAFPIRLPAYPPELDAPDRVYYQGVQGGVVILLWTDPGNPDRVLLSLLQFAPGEFASKGPPRIIQSTEVNGQEAIWAQGEHLLILENGQFGNVQFVVRGNVLIWTEGQVTYRLESDLPLEEALQVAESLR